MILRASYILFFLIVSFLAKAQIEVIPANITDFTPVELINDVFLGEGVEVISVKYDGKPKSVGEFKNGLSAINLDKGIIMTTGHATVAAMPNNAPNTQTGSSGNSYTDEDLSQAIGVSNDSISDICRYEIEFIPFTDSITFRYVFASEEYPEFSCNVYNDAFAFFISGPNPEGGMYVAKNIAIVPGTNEVVSIENVHPNAGSCVEKNGEFYNDNTGGQYMAYDGYLDVFVASAKVIPCKKYKIKIIIADIADGLYDSAVFLEAKSFGTDVLKTVVSTLSHEGTISESCGDANIRLFFNNIVTEDYNLDFVLLNDASFGKLAQEGIDFNSIPTDAKILKGQKSFEFNISAFEDNISEDEEIVAIQYRKDFCNLDTLFIKIIDNQLTKVELSDSIFICEGETKNVNAKFPNDYIPPGDNYFYNNRDYFIGSTVGSEVISEIDVVNVYPNTVNLSSLKEVCIDTLYARVLNSLDIFLISPDNKVLELSTNNGFRPNGTSDIDSMIHTCFTPSATLNINNGNSTQGDYFAGNPRYEGVFAPEGNWNDLSGSPVNGEWKLKIVNDEDSYKATLSSWHIAFNSSYKIDYKWSPNFNISCIDCLSPDISPINSMSYFFEMEDTYGCSSKDTIVAIVDLAERVPFVSCDSISTDYIRFIWGKNENGERYEVWDSHNSTWIEVTDTFFSISGLGFEEQINLRVRIIGDDCVNPYQEAGCKTYPCPPPQISLISKKDVTCFGDTDGEVSLSATGTKGPYVFRYNTDVNITGYFDNLPAGTNTVYIKDADDCEIPYVFEIGGPKKISFDYIIDDISCHGQQDGSISVIALGGNGGFNYTWLDKASGDVFHTNSINNLKAGTYYLTVVDNQLCENNDSVIINEPELLAVEGSVFDIECKGDNTGKILIEVTGGTKDYYYKWDTPVGELDIEDLDYMPSGVYKLTVTDANGCQALVQYEIKEPEDGLAVEYYSKDSLCLGERNGSITLNLSTSSDFSINWSTGDTVRELNNLEAGHYEVTITDSKGCQKIIAEDIIELMEINIELGQNGATCFNFADGEAWVKDVYYGSRKADIYDFSFIWSTNPPQTGRYAYDLKGGQIYNVRAENSIGCFTNKSLAIENPMPISIKVKSQSDISCFGFNDGSIYLEKIGGNDNSVFTWSPNANVGNQDFAENLKPGIYKVTLTDESGCRTDKVFSVKEPSPIRVSFDVKDVNCYGGADGEVRAFVKGGVEPFFYFWEGSSISKNDLTNLKKGNYKLRIVDFNGCEKFDSVEIEEPLSPLSSTVETVDVSCYGGYNGEIIINTTGGSPPYSNKVLGGKYYSSNRLIGLKKDNYVVITKDIHGCEDTLRNIIVGEPEQIIVDLGEDITVEYGTIVELNGDISNAYEPYLYHWIIPEGVDVSCVDCAETSVKVLYDILIKLEIEDSLGCKAKDEKNIIVSVDKGIFVPTAFNPNSLQGANKKLYVYGKDGVIIKSFIVFNKWGEEVYRRNDFEVNDETTGWDGTFKNQNLNTGVFAWKMELENKDGTLQQFKGYVTLIR